MSENEYPLPPPTFESLTLSLKMQTEAHLGMWHFGEEKDRPKPDFRVARHSIDMLAMLQEKTKGNLTIEEERLIENSLTELRFRYVQSLEKHKGQRQEAPKEASQEPKTEQVDSPTEEHGEGQAQA